MRGVAVEWTREQLERVMAVEGGAAHDALAEEFGVETNTIYSTRGAVQERGGIDEFLARNTARGARGPRRPPQPATLAEELGRAYKLKASGAGRNSKQSQWTLTVPPLAAQAFIAKFGNMVRYTLTEDGLLIVPAVSQDVLPSWAQNSGSA